MARYLQGKYTPKNPQKYVGDPKNIVFRSSWERHFLEQADMNPNVLNYASEEVSIPYYFPIDGKWHRYFPDFLMSVRERSGNVVTWMVEIKPESQTRHPSTTGRKTKRRMLKESTEYAKNQAKWAAADAYCQAKGFRFTVLTERDLFPRA